MIGAEIVAVDHGGIPKVVARQTDCTSAGWLHKSRHNRERIFRRRTKARRYFGCNVRHLYEDKINVGITRRTTRQVGLCLDGIAVGRPFSHLTSVLKYDAGHDGMILQILANARQVLDDVDSKAAKGLRFPDA